MRPASWKVLLGVGLALAVSSAVRAADVPADAPAAGSFAVPVNPSDSGSEVGASPVLFAGFIDKIFSPLNGVLGNRRAMIQVGFVGMLIALYIIWWRRH